jgi:2-oxoisovalerate dehydrogenase E2 component (dihydrolipoyl transacylase)
MASVTMPQLGESITEGTISKWLKKPGDQVKKYDSLVEVITDKVNAEVPSPLSGTLKEIKVAEGATVSVGTEICVIEEIGSETPSPSRGEGRGGGAAADLGGHAGAIPEPAAGPSPSPVTTPSPSTGEGRGGGDAATRLSPAVRALIEEHRISDAELSTITGSGIGGRISKKDVEDYVASGRRAAQPDGKERRLESRPEPRGAGDTAIALSPMRRAIAVNMARSKQTIPHAWTVTEVDMTAVVRERQRLKEGFKEREGIDLTFVPIVVKGVVESLRANPILNSSWVDDHVVRHREINIGVAVAIEDGLIVPVIRQADRLSIAGIAGAVDDLARRARAGKLTLEDVQGATFTVNNPGTFGTILSYSIIAPPQAAILAMDAIVKRPVVVEGDAIAVRSMMNLCLSFDHRVLDGVSAASFLQGVRRFLEGFSAQVPVY